MVRAHSRQARPNLRMRAADRAVDLKIFGDMDRLALAF